MTADADLVVVGGGASATLLLDALRRRCPRSTLRVVVVEGQHKPGRGVPYRTQDTAHRMNVPAIRLSVDPRDPDHLLRWLEVHRQPTDPSEYIPRRLYGDYLEWVFAGGDRRSRTVCVGVERATVTRMHRDGDRFVLGTDDGATLTAPAVVLAVGAPAGPVRLPLDAGLADDPAVITDPWTPGALSDFDGRRAVVVGTGLTMVDVALSLLRRPGVTIDAVSRHGLLPRAHPDVRAPAELPLEVPGWPVTAAGLRRALVDHAAAEPNGWQASIDLFRDASDGLWPRMSEAEQAKVLRRLSTEWNVHRHRMSPPVAMELQAAVSAGRLRLHAGHVMCVKRKGDGNRGGNGHGLAVTVCRRRSEPVEIPGDGVFACIGPSTDVTATTDPLLRDLFCSGLASAGPHRMGVRLDWEGTLVGADGQPVPGLSALGALRKGTVFETTAIPELRVQATTLADTILRSAASASVTAPAS